MSDLAHARMMLSMARKDLTALQNMVNMNAFANEIFGFHAQQAVEKALKAWLSLVDVDYPRIHDLEELLALLERSDLQWEWDRRKKRQGKHRDCGQTVLLTDRQARSDHRLVVASRHQAQVEALFRIRTRRRPGLGWPAHHWTDRTRSVHALSGLVALLLIRIVLLRLQDRHLAIGVGLLTARLRGIEEALVV